MMTIGALTLPSGVSMLQAPAMRESRTAGLCVQMRPPARSTACARPRT